MHPTGGAMLNAFEHLEMSIQQCECELWRDGDWRCELWRLDSRQQVRLYLGPHRVGDLLDGPGLDLERQAAVWRMSVQAEGYRDANEPRAVIRLVPPILRVCP